ncbi:hypothetical protein [Nostoc sp. DSM 114159]
MAVAKPAPLVFVALPIPRPDPILHALWIFNSELDLGKRLLGLG